MVFEFPLTILFLLMVRHGCMLACIRPLRGVLGVSGVIVVSLSLSMWMYPLEILDQLHLPLHLPQKVHSLFPFLLREVLIGLLIGLPCALLFEVVPFMGRLIDTFRGVQFAEQIAPEMGSRDSLLESYGGYFAIWFFFNSAYVSEWIRILLHADQVFPRYEAGKKFSTGSFLFQREALEVFLGEFFTTCIMVVIPLIMVTLSFELVLSALQKINSKFHLGHELSFGRAGMGVFFLCFLFYSGFQASSLVHSITVRGINALYLVIGSN